MHNSLLLNRVTPYGEKIYITLSAYLEVLHVACYNGSDVILLSLFYSALLLQHDVIQRHFRLIYYCLIYFN